MEQMKNFETAQNLTAESQTVGTVEQRNEEIIGRVAATKQQGNNSREFYFWINPKARVNPLDLLVVKEDTRRIYAQVLDITSYSDAESFLEVFASTDFGDVNLGESSVERVTYSVAKAQVLGTSDSVRMPVQFNSPVYLADELTIMELLRVGELEDKYRVPVGYIEQSNGVRVPVSMDIRWLTGPDGAHLNVSGKTRLAAKTSYVLFLISAILQRQEDTGVIDTAVIIFNVKGSDLLQIHEPNRLLASERNTGVNDDDQRRLRELREAWECMGLEAKPFDKEKVIYFLPSRKEDPNKINSDTRNLPQPDANITKQPENYFIYRYTLGDVRGKLQLLLSSQNLSEPQQQFIDALENSRDIEKLDNFSSLCALLSERIQQNTDGKSSAKGSTDAYYLGAHSSTVRVVKRFIETVTHHRTTGVFDYEQSTFVSGRHKLPSTHIKDSLGAGQILVIDIARIHDYERQWVFADVLKAVEELMVRGGREGLRKVVIFVDELNEYAPPGSDSPLIRDIIDITARGGSLGVILFGAEQFASRIHPQVYGNCANKAFGLTDATEAGSEPYRAFPREIKDRLSELQRGEMIISFDFFGQPLRVKFPPPACRKQEDVD
jgi:DNA helicase HerA-like ATPase